MNRTQAAYWSIGLGMVALLGVVALRSYSFTSRAVVFVPEDQPLGIAGAIANAAKQSGFDVGSSTLELPRDLASDVNILALVVARPLPSSSPGGSTTLAAHFEVAEDSDLATSIVAAEHLRDNVGISVNPNAGTIEFRTTLKDSLLAQSALDAVLQVVDSANRHSRIDRARAVRALMERQVAEARRQLRRAEDSLQSFLLRNRLPSGDPVLLAEQQRRSRDVELEVQVVIGLEGQLAQSRLEEARQISTFTYIIPPTIPPMRDQLLAFMAAGLGIFLLLALTWFWFFGRAFVEEWLPPEWKRLRGFSAALRRG